MRHPVRRAASLVLLVDATMEGLLVIACWRDTRAPDRVAVELASAVTAPVPAAAEIG